MAVLPSCKPRCATGRATSHSRPGIPGLLDFKEALHFDPGIGGQHRDTDRGASVATFVPEYRDHQVGSAIHDLGTIEETCIRVDETAKTDHASHPVEIAHCGPDLRDEIDAAST